MISFTVSYVFAGVVAANLLILIIGSILFVRWVIKTIGILRAAEFGTLFDSSARRAGEEVSRVVSLASKNVDEQRVLVMAMTDRLQELARALGPDAVKNAIEMRAQALSWAQVDSELQQRLHAERHVKRLERLIQGMTGTAADLAEAVKDGLHGRLGPNLAGRIESYCAQRGVRAGGTVPKKAAAGFER